MKYLKTIVMTVTFFTLLALGACGDAPSKDNTNATEQQGKEYTAAYICPMHCEGSGSQEAGKCPVCGMDYVKNEKHTADGHSH